MDLARTLAGTTVRAAGAVSSRWGAAVALPLFAAVARPRPVHPDDAPTMSGARRRFIRTAGIDRRGVDVAVYEWGDGDRTAVLAHGWNGRASQFAPLVRELVSEGFRVVAFDAPAHGSSDGRRTYLVDWTDVLMELQDRHGRFDTVIGHSFGGLAALVSVAGGVQADRVATVAAPADAERLLAQFQAMVGYSSSVSTALGECFARRYCPADPDPFSWLSAVRRPLAAGTPLLVVHDEGDRRVPFTEAVRIVDAHPGSRLLATTGLGHSRILSADPFLDAMLEFVAVPAAASVRTDEPRGRQLLPEASHAWTSAPRPRVLAT